MEILRQLLHLARDPCELPRRNVERHMRSMLRWPVGAPAAKQPLALRSHRRPWPSCCCYQLNRASSTSPCHRATVIVGCMQVRTWAMLALLVAVSTACVLVCSAALKTPETRWSTAVGAIAVVLAAAVMLVATRDADIARRHTSINEVLSGIGELQARTVALQLLASQLAPLGLQHFSQLLAAMMNKLDSTTMQAQQALFDMP